MMRLEGFLLFLHEQLVYFCQELRLDYHLDEFDDN